MVDSPGGQQVAIDEASEIKETKCEIEQLCQKVNELISK